MKLRNRILQVNLDKRQVQEFIDEQRRHNIQEERMQRDVMRMQEQQDRSYEEYLERQARRNRAIQNNPWASNPQSHSLPFDC